MSSNQKHDTIYRNPQAPIKQFVFDEKVAEVFEDMLERSVPGYRDVLHMTGVLAEKYVQPDTAVYDLGCSLGASSLVIRQAVHEQSVRLIAVDNSKAMIEHCRKHLDTQTAEMSVEVLCEDILNIQFEPTSFVVLNFTLQFIEKEKRLELLERISEAMQPGGALVLSEKILYEPHDKNEFLTGMHHDFKRFQGYSDLEISQKRTALENILIQETLEVHQERLQKAGFSKSLQWFQCFNFASILAIK